MKYKINEYNKLIRQSLKSFNFYSTALENIENRITELKKELETVKIKTTNYGERTSRGGEGSEVERLAEKRAAKQAEIDILELDHARLAGYLKRLNNALAALPKNDFDLIKSVYIEQKSREAICQMLFCSERSLHYSLRRIEGELALMLYGLKARERVLFVE